ncbi:MAG TPA: asparaginase [Gemmatimonadales bacterium]|jgi:L-asparaginase II|nr:asparaginase [Gemmatimonadales bacterium]
MDAPELRVEATRGALAESVHPVAAAVVDAQGRLIAASRDPDYVTWWRSAAKPFQALPLVEDGAAERFGLSDEELALVCASHSSEPGHLDLVERMMAKIGIGEDALACGVHTPLSPAVAETVARGAARMTPRWSNCSGKHTGMLALAKHHGWPIAGYNEAGHPVQRRILEAVARWTGADGREILLAVDGCTAVCFGLPLRRMAHAYARFGLVEEPAARRIAGVMMAHPLIVAGQGRLCTDLMRAWPGRVIAKVGADGIHCASLPGLGLGIALKVEDGDMRASGVALLEILRQLIARLAPAGAAAWPAAGLEPHARRQILNTRGVETGELRPAGGLRFFDA